MVHIEKINTIAIIILSFFIIQCTSSSKQLLETKNNNFVIYSADKDGLYLYNVKNNRTKKIVALSEIFLDNSLQILNDTTLIIGFKGEIIKEARNKKTGKKLTYPCSPSDSLVIKGMLGSYKYDHYTLYSENYTAININNGKTWTYKLVEYKHKEMDTLKVVTTKYSIDGETQSIIDSSYRCNSHLYSYYGISFCNSERFYSESNAINGKTIISRQGNLYLKEQGKESLILEFEGRFDPKFGNGYFQPGLSSKGNKVIFRDLGNFLKSGAGIFELNLETMEKIKITSEKYLQPLYSQNSAALLLFKKQKKENINDTWINDIYIYDLETKKSKKIGQGNQYLWY